MRISEIKMMETGELIEKGNALLKKLYYAVQMCKNTTSLITRLKPIKNELEKRGYIENINMTRFVKKSLWCSNGITKVR